jgi:hypothetical protein
MPAESINDIQHPVYRRLWTRLSDITFIDQRSLETLTTVGSHWPMSRAFKKQEIDKVMRAGTCMGCHQSMSEAELWKKVSKEGTIDAKSHLELMNKMIRYMAEKGIKPDDITN